MNCLDILKTKQTNLKLLWVHDIDQHQTYWLCSEWFPAWADVQLESQQPSDHPQAALHPQADPYFCEGSKQVIILGFGSPNSVP